MHSGASEPNPWDAAAVHVFPSADKYTFDVPPTPIYLETHGAHTMPLIDPLKLFRVVACVHVSTGAVRLLEIVPLTPRFISVGLVMLVDSAAPLLITRIFFVDPSAVAALAYVSFGAPSEVPALPSLPDAVSS